MRAVLTSLNPRAAAVLDVLVDDERPAWKLPARARYNYVCLLADEERWTEAIRELEAIVNSPGIARLATSDPALTTLKAKRAAEWARLFPSDLAGDALLGVHWADRLEGEGLGTIEKLARGTRTADDEARLATTLTVPLFTR